MAKVRVNTKGVLDNIKKAFGNVVKNDQMYAEIAAFTVERIQQKARLQKRMEQDGSDNAETPNLSAPYIKQRKQTARGTNGTDPEFFLPNVSRSQLTYTGQLLKSLKAKILRSGENKGTVELGFTGNRKDGQTNVAIYRKLLDRNKNYEVLALSKKAIDLIRNKVLTRLRQELIKQKLKK